MVFLRSVINGRLPSFLITIDAFFKEIISAFSHPYRSSVFGVLVWPKCGQTEFGYHFTLRLIQFDGVAKTD